MVLCSLRKDPNRHARACGSLGPYRSAEGNLLSNRRTRDRSDQEVVPDLASLGPESSERCGRGTAEKYRGAFEIPLLKMGLTHMLLRLRWAKQITSGRLADDLGDPSF